MSVLPYVFLLTIFGYVTGHKLNDILYSGDYEFIDLSYPFDNNTIYWPGEKKFEFTNKKEGNSKEDGSWYAAYQFTAGEHGGTHLDAPYHFFNEGKHPGEIPLERLIVPLIVADISSKVNDDPDFVLHKHHLDYLLNDNLGKPCVVIFKFGWSKFFYTDLYLNIDRNTGRPHFPGLSGEIAEWITSNFKNIVGVGVDVASVDPGLSTDFRVHKTFAKAGLYNMENVNLVNKIPEYGCTALVLPMKIASGTGAPLRLVAICPKTKTDSFNH